MPCGAMGTYHAGSTRSHRRSLTGTKTQDNAGHLCYLLTSCCDLNAMTPINLYAGEGAKVKPNVLPSVCISVCVCFLANSATTIRILSSVVRELGFVGSEGHI